MIKSNLDISLSPASIVFIRKSVGALGGGPRCLVIMLAMFGKDSLSTMAPRLLIGESGGEASDLDGYIEIDEIKIYVDDFAASKIGGKTLIVRSDKAKNNVGEVYEEEYLSW